LKNKKTQLKEGENAAAVAVLVSLVLSILKGIIGYLAGSILLITDALHNSADTLTSFASWFGLKISQKKPSEKFPYGYYKAENLTTLLVSGFILYASFNLFIEGYQKLFELSSLNRPLEALGIALTSSLVSFFLSRYLKEKGEKINSQSLIANANERKIDVFSSMIVFIGLLLTFYKVPYVEGIITMVISILALKIGFESGKDSIFALMDVSPSKEIEDKVRSILKSNTGIEEFKDLKLRKSGPFDFGEVKVKIRKHLDVKRAHEIADRIEKNIKKEIKQIESFTIHIEPYEAKREKIAIPVKTKNGLKSNIMKKFGRANYFIFVIWNNKKNKAESHYIKENPYKKEKVRAGFQSANFILKEKIDTLITPDIGGISFHTMRDNLVDMYKVEGDKVETALKRYSGGKLKNLEEATKELGEVSDEDLKTKNFKDQRAGRKGRRGRRRRGF
jgi:cation diffusion facilitator family transporter